MEGTSCLVIEVVFIVIAVAIFMIGLLLIFVPLCRVLRRRKHSLHKTQLSAHQETVQPAVQNDAHAAGKHNIFIISVKNRQKYFFQIHQLIMM